MATSTKVVSPAARAQGRCAQILRASPWQWKPGFFVILWLGLLPLEAWEGLPFLTDDPQPMEFEHWEIYVASIDFKTAGGWVGDGPHVEINYGVVPIVLAWKPA